MRQSIDELAKSVNLPNKTTKKVIDMLKHDIILSLYRKNPDEAMQLFQSSHPNPFDEKIESALTEGSGVSEKEIEELRKEKKLFQTGLESLPEFVSAKETQKFNNEINKKIADLWKDHYGKEFDPKIQSKNKRLSLFLMGPPGQGKTAAFIVAAKEVCADLGLHFVEHVSDDYVPSRKDFVMVVQECAGENSAITFGGIPKAEEIIVDGKKVSVLKKAINYRFTVFDRCAGGVLLFDDAANAAQVIQNVLLPVAQFGSFQGTKINNALIGFTGNLGSLDGTYTTELSSALRTRVIPML